MLFRGWGDTGREGIALWRVAGGAGPGDMGGSGVGRISRYREIWGVSELVQKAGQETSNRVRI